MLKRIYSIFLTAFAIIILAESFLNSANAKNLNKISYQAPEIIGIEKWFNGDPVKISDLKGKVVLVDFWTYSCINCIRTLPYMNALHEKYGDKGLVIIGVHSPEFEFEKNAENVIKAIKRFGIKYKVALDNNMLTWKNYENQYWPAHYLINQEGKVVYTHFGEGKYDVMENNVVKLLNISEAKKSNFKDKKQTFFSNQTPETYLGFARGSNNVNDSLNPLIFPKEISQHSWALQGKWKIDNEFVESRMVGDSLQLNFNSKKVFLVMASADGNEVKAEIFLNGKKIINHFGSDVKNGIVGVKESRLYELVNQSKVTNSLLEIKTQSKGLQAYAFTFGDL